MARGTAPPPKQPLPPDKKTSVFPSLAETALKAASRFSAHPLSVSSPGAPPALPSPQVAALQQENASLRQQLAAQGSLLEAQKTEITSLQAQLSALEQKLEAALDHLSTLPSRTMPLIKSLHFCEEIQAAIKRPKRVWRGGYIAAPTLSTSS
ncbi:hypothetical protein HPB52_000388 [Rhipicephalus sanguineus]|uniref:Uncharacterized protein n=1 Tax=Rhipicephalus sanguineus TaxID=34632 RepID=A0A9D4PIK8_RHISA|nr:hypothetical protein HPB52_000388 [Rhipicephalus sanguineus]